MDLDTRKGAIFMTKNPMQTDGFEFVEYASPRASELKNLFENMGFTATAQHKSQDITIYQQNDITFLLNDEPNNFAEQFYTKHGPSACGMGFRVKNAQDAFKLAIAKGAKPFKGDTSHIGKNIPAIYGIGDSLLYLIDQYNDGKVYLDNFTPTENAINANSLGLKFIDHLTHNVNKGQMNKWADYYANLFNFREIRYFDIQGKHTGLISRALTSPCNKIRIPLNESKDNKSQIQEFLDEYKGEGIQHIALSTDDIYDSITKMRAKNISFLKTPSTYYELIDKRLPNHNENIELMQENAILIDGGEKQGGGILLQIFTETVIGPIFFEIIQRKGNEGFGEGNFQALFDSIELDQVRRGIL